MGALLGAFVVVEGRRVRRHRLHPPGHHRIGYWWRRRRFRRQHRYSDAVGDRVRYAIGNQLAHRFTHSYCKRNGLADIEPVTDGPTHGTADRGADANAY
ncbi:MAG: hypothetical protein IH863_02560 [Chloroflexi bacterium]|nr:hypothetical protein [Chloroflexota bacterium]